MNVFTFTAALGKDCRTNKVNDQFVANFSAACNSGYGDRKQTIWVDCSYWGKGAEAVAPYLVKGQKVCISGELGHKDDGEYGWKVTCRVSSLTLIGKADGAKDAGAKPQKEPPPFQDDEVPF